MFQSEFVFTISINESEIITKIIFLKSRSHVESIPYQYICANMNRFKRLFSLTLALITLGATAQTDDIKVSAEKFGFKRKGLLSMFWGWNRAFYTDSDIHFSGDNYNFTLLNVPGHDKQTQLGIDPYLKLNSITIPQVNYGIGYFLTEKLELTFRVDHMKYVMSNSVNVKMDGYIENSGTQYDGVYDNEDFVLAYNFLSFEHTDGLNYINFGLNRHVPIWSAISGENGFWNLDMFGGGAAGILFPKTNTRLMKFDRYDEFHLAGYGLDLHAGARIIYRRHYFIQVEGKSGFINMPDIRTTTSENDRASQYFFFAQGNVTFGAMIALGRAEKDSGKQK